MDKKTKRQRAIQSLMITLITLSGIASLFYALSFIHIGVAFVFLGGFLLYFGLIEGKRHNESIK